MKHIYIIFIFLLYSNICYSQNNNTDSFDVLVDEFPPKPIFLNGFTSFKSIISTILNNGFCLGEEKIYIKLHIDSTGTTDECFQVIRLNNDISYKQNDCTRAILYVLKNNVKWVPTNETYKLIPVWVIMPIHTKNK